MRRILMLVAVVGLGLASAPLGAMAQPVPDRGPGDDRGGFRPPPPPPLHHRRMRAYYRHGHRYYRPY